MSNIGRGGIWCCNFENVCRYHGNNAKQVKMVQKPLSGIYFLKMVGQIDWNFDGMVPPMYQCGICHSILETVSVAIGTIPNVKNFKNFKMLQNWWNLIGLYTDKSEWDFWSWNFQNGHRCHGNCGNVKYFQNAPNFMKLNIIVNLHV